MTLGLLRRPLWRARSICFRFCAWLRDFPLRTFLLNIVHKYFQETNQVLFAFCFVGFFLGVVVFYFILFIWFFSGQFFSREHCCCGSFQQVGQEGVIVSGSGQFVWMAIDFVVVFPLHFFGSLGRWVVPCFVFSTACGLFTQISFCEGEVFFGFWCLLYLRDRLLLFGFCRSEVQLVPGSFQVASAVGTFSSSCLRVIYNLKVRCPSGCPLLRENGVQPRFAPLENRGASPCFFWNKVGNGNKPACPCKWLIMRGQPDCLLRRGGWICGWGKAGGVTHLGFSWVFDAISPSFLCPSWDATVWVGGPLDVWGKLAGSLGQSIAVSGLYSTWRLVTSGFTQESLLGPVLLLLTRDIPKSLLTRIIAFFNQAGVDEASVSSAQCRLPVSDDYFCVEV